jgi:hypothetical protein
MGHGRAEVIDRLRRHRSWLGCGVCFHPIVAARSSAGRSPDYTALTVDKNRSTSILRRLLSPDRDLAAVRTIEDARPVSDAPRCTSVMLEDTRCVPCEACWTLEEISCVAAPCSPTAAAIAKDTSDSFSMAVEIPMIAETDDCVAAWIPEICSLISQVAFAVCCASAFTS